MSRSEKMQQIRWPQHYAPTHAPVHVRNELSIDAPAATVWAWLVRASLWPEWYANSKNLIVLQGSATALAPNTRFRWTTFGVRITSEVKEFIDGERLAWDAKAFGIDAYHAWLLTPTPRGCHVITEETQHGFIARAGGQLFPTRMHRFHQLWLESLAARAATGLPPER